MQVERRLRRAPKLRADIEAELPELYLDALRSMYREVDGVPRPPMPSDCPFTLRRADCGASGMSDRLALSNAIEDAGIERAKAERVASVIVDLIHDSATDRCHPGRPALPAAAPR